MKKCPKCGAENPDEKKWCINCMKVLQDTPAATTSHDTTAGKSRLSGSMGSKTYQKPNEQKTAGDKLQSPVSGFAHSVKKEDTDACPTKRDSLYGTLGNHKRIDKDIFVTPTPNKGNDNPISSLAPSKLRGSVGGKRFEPTNMETVIPPKIDPLFIDSDSSMGRCTKCGKKLIKNVTLCPHCGKANNNTGERKQKRNICRIAAISAAVALLLSIGLVCLYPEVSGDRVKETELNLPDTFMPDDLTISEEDVVFEDNALFADSQILLTAKSDTPYEEIEKMVQQEDGEIIGFINFSGNYHIDFPKGKTYDQLSSLIDLWEQADCIENVSLNYVFSISPNALDYSQEEWENTTDPSMNAGMDWDESNPYGNNWWAEAIRMPTVWEMDIWESNNYTPINIGVIDGVFDESHKDLENVFEKTWNNAEGWEKINNARPTNEDEQNELERKKSHGTHVAGLIAAEMGNGSGIAGVAACARPTLYGFSTHNLSAQEYCGLMHYIYAFALMLEQNVKVINISQGFTDPLIFAAQMGNQDARNLIVQFDEEMAIFLKKAIAVGYDFLIVKGAGNTSDELFIKDENSLYGYREYEKADKKNGETGVSSICSAKYGLLTGITDPEVSARIITVGASQPAPVNDITGYIRVPFSNIDCDVYAPGYNILSTVPGKDSTATKDGTSMATPIVSGIAALVWSVNPELTGPQIKNIIVDSYKQNILNAIKKTLIVSDVGIISTVLFDLDEVSVVDAAYAVNKAIELIGSAEASAETNTTDTCAVVGSVYYEITETEGKSTIESVPGALIGLNAKNDESITYYLMTDEFGGFANYYPAGEYSIRITADGYEPFAQDIRLVEGEVLYLPVSMVPLSKDDPVSEQDPIPEQNLVISAYIREYQYTVKKYNEETKQSVPTNCTAVYDIPQINLDSDEVRQINEELYNSLYPVIERAASEIFSDGFSVSSEEISYRWAVNGDILSLVVKNCGVPDFGGGTEYYVYNISISTGTRVSNEAVISSAGFSQNEFYESAKQSLKASYASGWDSSNWNDAINQQCEKTISNENIDQSYPYINEKGQLCIIAKRYTLAGAACYWGDFNLVDFEPLPFATNS